MKKVNLFEYKDLSKEIKEKVKEKELNDIIEFELNCLSEELNKGLMTEKEYYDILGCSKSYADTTAWFVPSCYYEKNKKQIEKELKRIIKEGLYTSDGKYVCQIKEEEKYPVSFVNGKLINWEDFTEILLKLKENRDEIIKRHSTGLLKALKL